MDSIFDTPEYKERWAMYQSALDAGIPIVSTETCAIICAMLLVWGNTAEFTHNHRLVCELQYAQKRFGIEGGSVPNDRKFLTAFNYYTDLLTPDLLQWTLGATIGIKYSKQFALNKQAQKVKYVATDIVAEEPETPSGGGDNNGGGNPPSGELEG